MTKQGLKITGMHCASCAVNIESLLKKQTGVTSVSVNYADSTAHLEYNSGQITLSAIFRAIEKLGYSAVEFEKYTEQDERTEINLLKKTFIGSPVFCLSFYYLTVG